MFRFPLELLQGISQVRIIAIAEQLSELNGIYIIFVIFDVQMVKATLARTLQMMLTFVFQM